MTIVNKDKLEALYTALNTAFKEGVTLADVKPSSFSMMVPSTTKIEQYPILMMLSTIREWIGPRHVNTVKGEMLKIINRPFEHTLGVQRDDINDGAGLGILPFVYKNMGVDAENLWGRLDIEALLANDKWLDGKAFFVADRKFEKSTICNLTTDALTPVSYAAARLLMMNYKNHAGQSMGIVPDTLLVGPALEATAKKILENDKIVTAYQAVTNDATKLNHVAEANPNYKTAVVEMNPQLTEAAANYWFLGKTKGVMKPIIIQKREVGGLIAWDTDHDQCVKDHDRNDYGCKRRGAAALAMPPWCFGGLTPA
ncbi:MAG: Mu-like prophage major head subunit gpT family protein [Chlorobiaceae bacterium]